MELGILEKVDLRNVWPNEATKFTIWLMKKENISLLEEELDLQFDNIEREGSAGRYSVDIVADEIQSGKKVIIENQLEQTDHKHLGQLITYASAFEACFIIWVVKDYTEEHKQAIDWFNKNMPDDISFFLVQVELWQIGNSAPAPHFDVICQPNNWAKKLKKSKNEKNSELSDLKLLQQKFWEELKSFSNTNNYSNLNLGRRPRPQHWFNISIGTSRAHLVFTFNSKEKRIGCELYIRNDQELFKTLKSSEKEIKQVLGASLEFQELPEKTASRIALYYDCEPKNRKKWEDYFKWLLERGSEFQTEFKKYI